MDFEVMEILRDPAQQSGESSFLGFLSNIGVWLWISSAAICFFSAICYRHVIHEDHQGLLFLTGLLALILGIDDFFLIHDRFIDQNICYLLYAVLAIALLVRHYKRIIEIHGFSFLCAGLLLASSIVTDLVQSYIALEYEESQILEEGFKFTGAASWLYFSACAASFGILQNTRLSNKE